MLFTIKAFYRLQIRKKIFINVTKTQISKNVSYNTSMYYITMLEENVLKMKNYTEGIVQKYYELQEWD